MTAIRSVAAAATELSKSFRGELLKSGDAGYEEARKVHNGLVDKRPALIRGAVERPTWPMPSSSRKGWSSKWQSAGAVTTWRDAPLSTAA